MTTTVSPGKGKVRGHCASIANLRKACDGGERWGRGFGQGAAGRKEQVIEAGEGAHGPKRGLRATAGAASAACLPAQPQACPGAPGAAPASGGGLGSSPDAPPSRRPHRARQQVGEGAHVALQGGGVQQQVARVAARRHRPAQKRGGGGGRCSADRGPA
jgi:hypothetical protein